MARNTRQVINLDGDTTIDPNHKGRAVVKGKQVNIVNTLKTAMKITSTPSLREKKVLLQYKRYVLVQVNKDCLWAELA